MGRLMPSLIFCSRKGMSHDRSPQARKGIEDVSPRGYRLIGWAPAMYASKSKASPGGHDDFQDRDAALIWLTADSGMA